MKKNERRMILMLVIIAIIIIAVLVKVKNGRKAQAGENGTNAGTSIGQNGEPEEFVNLSEDGTKVNTSSKLSETKKFENYEISNIKLTAKDGQSLVLADVKNVGEAKTDVTLINIKVLDKEGNEITTIGGIIGDLEAGATTQLNASATADFANAFDIAFEKSDASVEPAPEAAPEAEE